MGDISLEVRTFRALLTELGPQWIQVDGVLYHCLTSIRNTTTWFIATKPRDLGLFRVNPFSNQVTPIEVGDVPCGDLLPPHRHVHPLTLVQLTVEAWRRDQRQGLKENAAYLVAVYMATRLMMVDETTQAFIALLNGRTSDVTGRLKAYSGDSLSSPRLRAAWADAVIELALDVILKLPA